MPNDWIATHTLAMTKKNKTHRHQYDGKGIMLLLKKSRHPDVGRGPLCMYVGELQWIPAFAGMTVSFVILWMNLSLGK